MQAVVSQIRRRISGMRRTLWHVISGLLMLAPSLAAQRDSLPVGPPPHFAAAWAPPGTFIDVSRADTLQHRLSLDVANVSINTAIQTIMDKGKIRLVYLADIFPTGLTVSIHAEGITTAAALGKVLAGTGVDVLMLQGGHLVLDKCPHVSAGVAGGRTGVVTGRVTDRTTGAPLAGAVVTVQGTPFSAVANAEGVYRLGGLVVGKQVLSARYIGYRPSGDTIAVIPAGVVHDLVLEQSAQPLEQVVVTGTLVPTEVKALPTPVTVVTADDIRRQNVMRLDQLFRGQVANAFAWDKPGEDYGSVITVRGASSFSAVASVKTFIDGIEVEPQFAPILMDPNSIERIELTRGPQASTMYGSNAISGVLQIFTKKGALGLSRPGGEIKTSAGLIEKNAGPGMALRLQDAVTLHGGDQHTRYQTSAYYRHDGEWTPHYGNNNWNVIASAENVRGPVTSRITALFAQKISDLPDYTALRDSALHDPNNPNYAYFSKSLFERFNVQTQTYGASFTYAATPWWRHDLTLGYDRWAINVTQTERRLTTPDDTLFLVVRNQRSKKSIFYFTTIDATVRPTVKASFTVGFNHYALDGSDVLHSASAKNTGPLDGPASDLDISSTNSGYFTQAQVNLAETVFLTAGLRAERNLDFGENVGTIVSPRLGAAYVRPVGPITLKVRASYGDGIRAPLPNQNQSFSGPVVQLHNPALRPERQHGSDGGVDLYWGSRASLRATFYSQKVIDLIDLVYDSMDGDPSRQRQQSQYQNVGSIRNRGWEIEAGYDTKRLQASGALSVVHSRILQLNPGYTGNYRSGDRLFDVPSYTAGLNVSYHLSPSMALRGSVANVAGWVERDWIAFYPVLVSGAPARPSDRDYWITYPGFTKVRVGLEQKLWKGITGTLDVENLTNNQAFESHNIAVPPPRTVTVALQMPY